MVKVRSPAYPTIGLREAIEKIRLVYEKDYQNKIPRPLVAEHMGYRSLNGKSLGVLSAVSKFGLLEGRAEANWVSELALQIIAHAPGTPERARALTEAAARPELFSELDAKFQNGKVSDGAIRSYLMTQKFIPQAADAAIRSYRETKALVSEEASGYIGNQPPHSEPEGTQMPAPGPHESQARPGLPPTAAPIGNIAGERELVRGPISRTASYRLLVSGHIGAAELTKIIRILTVYKELFADDGEEDDQPTDA